MCSPNKLGATLCCVVLVLIGTPISSLIAETPTVGYDSSPELAVGKSGEFV